MPNSSILVEVDGLPASVRTAFAKESLRYLGFDKDVIEVTSDVFSDKKHEETIKSYFETGYHSQLGSGKRSLLSLDTAETSLDHTAERLEDATIVTLKIVALTEKIGFSPAEFSFKNREKLRTADESEILGHKTALRKILMDNEEMKALRTAKEAGGEPPYDYSQPSQGDEAVDSDDNGPDSPNPEVEAGGSWEYDISDLEL